jgi:hypothetical protein
MFPAVLEPAIPARERQQTLTLDRWATGIGEISLLERKSGIKTTGTVNLFLTEIFVMK